MGVRGEVFSVRVQSLNDRRTYFLNVKENRTNDLFLTVVESKKKEGTEEFDRHQVVVFEEDIESFAREFEKIMAFFRERSRPASRRPRPVDDRDRSNRDRPRYDDRDRPRRDDRDRPRREDRDRPRREDRDNRGDRGHRGERDQRPPMDRPRP